MRHKLLVILFFVAHSIVAADLKLPAILGDNMVLQRDAEAPLWGSADANAKVSVKLDSAELNATADANGKWLVKLPPTHAGGPHEITIQCGEHTLALKNVLFGEVWVCSGQSNMEMSLSGTEEASKDIAEATDPQIRLFTVTKNAAGEPQADCQGKWLECSPKTVPGFSAVAYFFGAEIHKTLNVPVGLIHTSWGGTPAEAWTVRADLESVESLKPLVVSWDEKVAGFDEAKAKEKYAQTLKKWEEAVAKAKEEKKPAPKKPNFDDPRHNPWRTSSLYNGMIARLLPVAIAGAIWYQGESNVGRAAQYRILFPAMIESWRKAWNRPDLPFYFVQIAPYQYKSPDGIPYAELCESQLVTMKKVPHTGMAVINDVGNITNIHPKNKKTVGHRLALWALADTYGRKETVFSGPIYKEMKVEGDKIRLSFDYVNGGLVSRDGKDLTHFTIAGENQKFEPATATIDGNTIVVHSDKVAKPVAVRFSWHETAEPNLMNKEGLPASLFRTDDWKMVTEGK